VDRKSFEICLMMGTSGWDDGDGILQLPKLT